MPGWLIEGSPTVYLLLALVGLISLAAWWRTRKRTYLAVASAAGVLILGYFALDRVVESDAEQIGRRLQEMADGVTARDYDHVFRHMSDSFFVLNVDKGAFRRYADEYSRRLQVTSLTIWDVVRSGISRERRRAEVGFRFKIQTNLTQGYEFFFARTVFVLDPDGQWRLQSFEVFNPYSDSKQPLQVPGWGR
jgi:hypothetical protein